MRNELPWHARALEWFIDHTVGQVEEWRRWPDSKPGVQQSNRCACNRDCTLGCDE